MSKVKDLDLGLTADDLRKVDDPEQSVEDFLAVMEANERGYYVNVIQPNEAALSVIAGLKDFIEKSEPALFDEAVIKAAQVKLIAAIKSIKLEV